MYCIWIFFPSQWQMISNIVTSEILPGSLHSRRSTVDVNTEDPPGELEESDYSMFIDYCKQYGTSIEASDRLAMYLCCTSLP